MQILLPFAVGFFSGRVHLKDSSLDFIKSITNSHHGGVIEGTAVTDGRKSKFGVLFKFRVEAIYVNGDEPAYSTGEKAFTITTYIKNLKGIGEQTVVSRGDRFLIKNIKFVSNSHSGNSGATRWLHHLRGVSGGKLFSVDYDSVVRLNRSEDTLRSYATVINSLVYAGRINNRAASFLRAIFFGETSYLDNKLKTHFRNLGISHLLAVSGLHISIITLILLGVFQFVFRFFASLFNRIPLQKITVIVVVPVVWVFAIWVTVPKPPVLRAATMITIFGVSRLLNRKVTGTSLIAVSAMIITALDPEVLFSASFLLSFSAVVGIMFLSKDVSTFLKTRLKILEFEQTSPCGGLVKRLLGKLCELIGVTVAATAATIPFIIFFFSSFSYIAPVSNVIFVPLFSLIVLPANFIFGLALLIGLHDFVLNGVASVVNFINSSFLKLVEVLDNFPAVSVSPDIALFVWIVLISGLLFSLMRKKRMAILSYIFAVSIIFLHPVCSAIKRSIRISGKVVIFFPEIGQEDCALIRTPGGSYVLIDAGSGTSHSLSRLLAQWRVKKISLVIITHAHRDHYGGLKEILESDIRVENLFLSSQPFEEPDDIEFLQLIETLKKKGTSLTLNPSCGGYQIDEVEFKIISPCEPGGYDPVLDWNNNSIVVHLGYRRFGALFTGDMEIEGEEKIKMWKDVLPAQLLKVPHHGSSGASGDIITGWSGVKFAVITAGKNNRSGLPSPSVVYRYRSRGIRLFTTGREGEIVVVSNGREVRVFNYRWEKIYELRLIKDGK